MWASRSEWSCSIMFLSCASSKIIYVMAHLVTHTFWDVWDGKNTSKLSSYISLLKGNNSFRQHRVSRKICQSACRPWHFHPSQVHPFQTHPKTGQKTPKSGLSKAYWEALWPSSYPSEWLKHPWLKTQIGFHVFSGRWLCRKKSLLNQMVTFWISVRFRNLSNQISLQTPLSQRLV